MVRLRRRLPFRAPLLRAPPPSRAGRFASVAAVALLLPGLAHADQTAFCRSDDYATLLNAATEQSVAVRALTPVLPAATLTGLSISSGGESPRLVRVFEAARPVVPGPAGAGGRGPGDLLQTSSIDMAEPRPGGTAGGRDAIVRFRIPPRAWFDTAASFSGALRPRDTRFFVVFACLADASGQNERGIWGQTAVGVSRPSASIWISLVIGALIYGCGALALKMARQRRGALEAKYPAVFRKQQLGWNCLNPIHLIEDNFNKASVQKLQVLVFSFEVGLLVIYLVLQTGTLTELSATVLALLGISGIGAAVSHAAYQSKDRLSLENWAWLVQRGILKAPDQAKSAGWSELFMTAQEFDIYKTQTLIFSIGVAFALLIDRGANLSSFEVPSSLLGILGLSQVVYVGGIASRAPSVQELDAAITRLRGRADVMTAARLQGTDTDHDGKLVAAPAGAVAPATNAAKQYDDLARSVATMIETTLEVEVDESKIIAP